MALYICALTPSTSLFVLTGDVMKITPALLTFADALAYTGFNRTRMQSELHKLDVRKAGRRIMITRVSLDAMISSLPKRPTDGPRGSRR